MSCRRLLASLCAVLVGIVGLSAVRQAVAARAELPVPGDRPLRQTLQLLHTPPTLVRAGEVVRIPVDAICATPGGLACPVSVSLAARVAAEPWIERTAPLGATTVFDLTAFARRAVSSRVSYFLRARSVAAEAALPPAAQADPLHFYVTDRMPTVTLPALAFGHVRHGRTVLSVRWGSGRGHAGIQPGSESETLGPSSFDVDRRGRVYVADAARERLTVLAAGRVVREAAVLLSPFADVAAAPDGRVYVADRARQTVTIRTVDPHGRVGAATAVARGILSQLRLSGGDPFVHVLPSEQWVSGRAPASRPSMTGRPLAGGGELLLNANEHRVRLGTARHGAVVDAVEVRAAMPLGEVALADPDGAGGYWLVAHVWREVPSPADQYQVVHVRNGVVLSTFAVANAAFANTPGLSRFRMVGDVLYQLTTSPAGMTVVSYDLGGER